MDELESISKRWQKVTTMVETVLSSSVTVLSSKPNAIHVTVCGVRGTGPTMLDAVERACSLILFPSVEA